MAHILIIGHGLNGLTAALQLNRLTGEDDWITLLSQERYGLISSALPYVSVGLRAMDQARIEIAPLLARQNIRHILGGVAALYPERQVVVLENGQRVPFDYLIIADGMAPAFDHIPGVSRSQRMVHSLTSENETLRAELAFQDFLNAPGPMTVAVSPGSGDYQNAYQYVFNVDQLLRRRRLRDQVPISFVTSEPFLGHFGIGGIGNSNALFESAFRARQIQWICNAAVDRVEPSAFHIVHFDDEGVPKGRKLLESRYGMVWPALRSQRFVTDVDGLVDRGGLIPTNKFLQSVQYPHIFALGDIVAQKSSATTPMETPEPCSDFLRESMTSSVAGNVAEVIRQRYPLYEPTGNGFFMVDFGGKGAAFLAVPQRPPRNIDRIYRGRFVAVVKRAMERYHLQKLRVGVTEPLFERLIFRFMKVARIKRRAA